MAADVPADALEQRTTELLNIIIQFPSDTHSVQCSTNVEWWRNWKRTFIAPNNTPGPRFRIYCDLRKLFQRRLILTNQSHPLTFSSPYQSIQCKPRESSKHILNKNNSIHFQCLLLIRRCPRLSLSPSHMTTWIVNARNILWPSRIGFCSCQCSIMHSGWMDRTILVVVKSFFEWVGQFLKLQYLFKVFLEVTIKIKYFNK